MLVARVTNGSPYYYHSDGIGSTRLTDSSNNVHVVFSDGYQPYWQDNGPDQGSETFKFTGKRYSPTT